MWVGSLGQEDRLEKEMATPSSSPAWEIPRGFARVGNSLVAKATAEEASDLVPRHVHDGSSHVFCSSEAGVRKPWSVGQLQQTVLSIIIYGEEATPICSWTVCGCFCA